MRKITRITANDVAALDEWLPPGLTDDMRHMVMCLFATMVDAVRSTNRPDDARMHDMARLAAQQLADVMEEMGGRPLYIPKGAAVQAAIRSCNVFADWSKGAAIRHIASAHGLTEERVRQIIRARRNRRQETSDGV